MTAFVFLKHYFSEAFAAAASPDHHTVLAFENVKQAFYHYGPKPKF